MGSVKLSVPGQIIRFLFIFWNVIVLAIGAGAIGVGSWLLVRNNDYDFVTGDEYISGAVLLIIAGVVDILVCALGIVGAIMLWPVLLGVYAFIVGGFVALEIAAGIIGFIYRNDISDRIGDRTVDAIQTDYRNGTDSDGSANQFIDFIQNEFDCCGWNNFSDWDNSAYMNATSQFPESCTCSDVDVSSGSGDNDFNCGLNNQTNQLIYHRGCQDSVTDELRNYLLVEGAVGIVFGILQILAILVAVGLCVCVRRARSEYTTV